MSFWSNGVSFIALTASGIVSATLAGDPPAAAPGPGEPTISININDNVGPLVAPCSVKMRLTFSGAALTKPTDRAVYDPTFRGLHYCTSWGDPGQFRNDRVMHGTHRDRNISYAPDPVHTYTAPGTYVANVYIFDDQGNWGVAQRTYVIAAPDDYFTLAQTIVLAPDADYTGAPSVAAENRFSSGAGLEARINTLLGTGNGRCRVLFKGGQTFDWNGMTQTTGTLYFGTWGAGRGAWRPPQGQNNQQRSSSGGFVMTNLRFIDDYSPVSETGEPQRWLWMETMRRPSVITVNNCDYDNGTLFFYPITLLGSSGFLDVIFNDCTISGTQTFIALTQIPYDYSLNILGCRIAQPPGTANGWMEEWQTGQRFSRNSGWALRGSGDLVIEGSAFYSKGDWCFGSSLRGAGNRVDGPSIRWGASDATIRVYLGRTIFEGPVVNEGNYGSAVPHNWLADKCTFVMHPCALNLSETNKGGAWWQNCIMIFPDHIRAGVSTGTPTRALGGSAWAGASNIAAPIGAVHNTVLDLRQPERQPGTMNFSDFSGFSNITLAQNVIYAPFRSTPTIPSGGMTHDAVDIDALYDGIRLGWELGIGTLPSAVANNAFIDLPYPDDWYGVPTTQASFTGTLGRHIVQIAGGNRLQPTPGSGGEGNGVQHDAVTVQLNAGTVRVTNRSGGTWSSGAEYRLHLDRGTTLMALDTTHAQPAGSLALPRPTGVTAVSGSVRAFDDFACRLRPGTGRANAPAGTACQGALEPSAE
jgi:hypothetical protein